MSSLSQLRDIFFEKWKLLFFRKVFLFFFRKVFFTFLHKVFFINYLRDPPRNKQAKNGTKSSTTSFGDENKLALMSLQQLKTTQFAILFVKGLILR